jgi:hypothetical protein
MWHARGRKMHTGFLIGNLREWELLEDLGLYEPEISREGGCGSIYFIRPD